MEPSWRQAVQDPDVRHAVQIYREPVFLRRAVAAWVAPALRHDGGAALLGRPQTIAAVLRELRAHRLDAAALAEEGRLVTVDAEEVIRRHLAAGEVDERGFETLVTDLLARVRRACGAEDVDVRAWGEIVNVLRGRGQADLAERLEACWDRLVAAHGFRLLCSYEMDNLAPETHAGALAQVCRGHGHLLPERDDDLLEYAVGRAVVDVLGDDEAERAWEELAAYPRTISMPESEAVLVALMKKDPALGARLVAATRAHMERLGAV